MKMLRENNPDPAGNQPLFHKVAENLYRLESSRRILCPCKEKRQAISSLLSAGVQKEKSVRVQKEKLYSE
jgi:hypothetical protein